MPVASWVRNLTEEIMGSAPFVVGDMVLHPSGRTVKITSGQYWGDHGSNHWRWREVLPGGGLAETVEHGYGWRVPQDDELLSDLIKKE